MITTLVIPAGIAARLRELAGNPLETGGVLLARPVRNNVGDLRLLARYFEEVPEGAYSRRTSHELLISSDGFVPALRLAEEDDCVPIWLHTHPGEGASPEPSRHDKVVDTQLSEVFRLRADSDFYGSLIISASSSDITFTGNLDDGNSRHPIDRVLLLDERFALHNAYGADDEAMPELLDRNVRAFGGDVQRVLNKLRVAVVGCGGTGSAVIEQLVRLGVRNFILLDSDKLSQSNLTRVYGSHPADVGEYKVEVLRKHILSIAPDANVDVAATDITSGRTARQIVGADIAFGCTDDNAGRLILCRLSTYLLLPVIDCGVLLSSNSDSQLQGIDSRVTVMHPGAACLICRGRIDMARASSEMLSPEERAVRVREGYAPALQGVEPAVVTFTSMTAALAVSELLERLTGYGVDPDPNEVLLRLHDRELSTNRQEPRPRHFCDHSSGKWGLGETEPFLEQVWPS